MNMFDEARSIAGMMALCRTSQSEIARKMGVSQSYVANKLRLLRFDDAIQKKIGDAGLTERHARALLGLSGDELRIALDRVISERLSVAETEALVDLYRVRQTPRVTKNATRVGGIDAFLVGLRKSIELLSGLGIEASEHVGHHGSRTYVTICFEE